MANSTQQIVIVGQQKSMALSIILSFIFGPLGMLYSTIAGGIIMFLVSLPIIILTGGFGLVILLPVYVIWAAIATNSHNAKFTKALANSGN